MKKWIRFDYKEDKSLIGTQDGDYVDEFEGDLLQNPKPTGRKIPLNEVQLQSPFEPHSIFALWNNFHERAEKEGQTIPHVPLYFMKPLTSVIGPEQTIYRPLGHQGRVIFEAELGIVIGSKCRKVSESEAAEYIFGYTCVNDVTAIEFLFEDKAFQQWTRSKGYDTFTPIGPCIATGIDTDVMSVKALQSGETRQDYPVSDMIFSPKQIVSMLSHCQTLLPGDLICCGTSVGARTMKPGTKIDIVIPDIGTLSNPFDDLTD